MRIPLTCAPMKTVSLVLLVLAVLPSTSRSQSQFDGTWVVVSSKIENEKPIVFLVTGGVYRSADRVLKTDGKDYEVPATGYWDTVSVLIVDDHTVEVTSKKAGKPMFTETDKVSGDGNTLTQVVKDMTESKTLTFENLYKRVAPSPPGAHVLSGTWQVFKRSAKEQVSITYKCTSDGFSAVTSLGEGFDAKFDGKFYLMQDDPARTMVAVKRVNANTVEMTNQRDGKIVFVVRLEVTPDGKTIRASSESKEGGSRKTWELARQPK
jgi:hypothetical protein